jgi:hypothetical protein
VVLLSDPFVPEIMQRGLIQTVKLDTVLVRRKTQQQKKQTNKKQLKKLNINLYLCKFV